MRTEQGKNIASQNSTKHGCCSEKTPDHHGREHGSAAYFNDPGNHAIAWQLTDSQPIYIAYNGWSSSVNFTLPSPPPATTWYRVTDTCNWAEGPNQVSPPGTEAPLGSSGFTYNLCARGVLLLIAR